MPIFQHIELYLDSTYSSVDQKKFIFCSRSICNFIERALVGVRFQSPYSRLNIHCTKNLQLLKLRPLKNESYLEAVIPVDLEPLDSMLPEVLQNKFAQVITSGLQLASSLTPVPAEECSRALKEFEDNGFKNCWVHLDKNWSKWNCRCVISAELTMDAFELDQTIYRRGELIAKHRIAQTKPREGLFVDYLGNISISTQGIITYKKKNRILSIFDLESGVFSDSQHPPTSRG